MNEQDTMSQQVYTTSDSQLVIKTDVYEGPFEVLLSLIQKRKLFINDLSLSQVTDDFLNYINKQNIFPVEVSTQFLEVASTLMLIKSKSLLPTIDLRDDEEEDIADLENRLAMYKKIKDIRNIITAWWGKTILYSRQKKPVRQPIFTPDTSITIDAITTTAQNIITTLPTPKHIPQTEVHARISLKETIDKLSHRIQRAIHTSFSQFSGYSSRATYTKEERIHIVVHFLALLELVKTGVIEAKQSEKYDDISVENTTIDTPRYDNVY